MIVFNFSVLARPAESLALRQPDPEGREIWSMFFTAHYGRICLAVNEDYPREQLEEWLKKEGFKPSFYETILETQPVLVAERVHRISAVFGKAKWYVDNDPQVCAETLKLGIPTMLVASPYIIRPEWNVDKTVKPWDTLVEEVNRQHLLRANKTWRDEL